MTDKTITVELHQKNDFQFVINFGDPVPPLLGDEPSPLGQGLGPSPVQLLAAAVGNCLSDSLLFAFRKFKLHPEPIQARVETLTGRNTEGRIRVLGINVVLKIGVEGATLEHLSSVLDQFESFCTVTQSVGLGIPIHTRVLDVKDLLLKESSI